MYFTIFVAAFFYEILALAILDRIGLEEKAINQSGMVICAYGLMGIWTAFSFWIPDLISSTSTNLLVMMTACLSLSVIVLFKKNVT